MSSGYGRGGRGGRGGHGARYNVNEETKTKVKDSVTLKRLIREMKPLVGWIILSSTICIAGICLELIGPKILGNIVDILYAFWTGELLLEMKDFGKECLKLLGVYILSGGAQYMKMFIMSNAVSRYFTCAIRIKISDKLSRIPVSYIDSTPNGELISRIMHDVSRMGNSVHTFMDTAIIGFFKLIGVAIIILKTNAILSIPVLAFVPLSIMISAKIAGKARKYHRAQRALMGESIAIIEEDCTGFETIRAFNLAGRQNRLFFKKANEYCEQGKKGVFISMLVQPIIVLTNNIAYIAICLMGGYMAAKGTIPVGEIISFILYAKMISVPLESIANGLSQLQGLLASARRVYELLDEEEMTPEKSVPPLKEGKGEVVFENVCFSYDKNKPLIKNLNVHVQPGQKVAIVGPTGGGKTTIINLLMRFYDIDSGRITIDGIDTQDMNRNELRNLFGMVLQDTWLFNGTIYDNIAYGCEGATREQVEEAARKAHLDYYIGTLPEGYDTIINEESTNISGGQKQLLTIARAYLANRKMLILDEATSNVDTRTEILIQQTMDELMHGRTSFVIAHRLSTIVDADIILVVKNGEVVESGTHEALMEKNGFYTEIYNSQYELLK